MEDTVFRNLKCSRLLKDLEDECIHEKTRIYDNEAMKNDCVRSCLVTATAIIKVNKSVYIVKSRQRYDKTLNFLQHVPNHALKDMYMLNCRTINNTNSLYYSFIKLLIDIIVTGNNSVG